jgi:calpain-15
VRLLVSGKPTLVTIDDYIPCFFNNRDWVPAFATTNKTDQAIWPLLLEKAWAKVHGNYEKTISGSNKEAVLCLTGAPSI